MADKIQIDIALIIYMIHLQFQITCYLPLNKNYNFEINVKKLIHGKEIKSGSMPKK